MVAEILEAVQVEVVMDKMEYVHQILHIEVEVVHNPQEVLKQTITQILIQQVVHYKVVKIHQVTMEVVAEVATMAVVLALTTLEWEVAEEALATNILL